jgi:hypothetical protein
LNWQKIDFQAIAKILPSLFTQGFQCYFAVVIWARINCAKIVRKTFAKTLPE